MSNELYETKCDELAAIFLSDNPHLVSDVRLMKLSAFIQSAIQDWINGEYAEFELEASREQ